MMTQQAYNELLEDGFAKAWLDHLVDLGVTLPRSKRYIDQHPDDNDDD